MTRVLQKLTAILISVLLLGCCTSNINKKIDLNLVEPDVIQNPVVQHEEPKDCSAKLEKHTCNFEFYDQYDNRWELYDHYGDIIVLDFSAMWCGVCQYVAQDMQSFYEAYENKGIIWVTILLQDLQGMPVTSDQALEWAQAFKITTAPVLAADVSIADPNKTASFPVQVLPTIVVLDRDMVVSYVMDGWNETRLLNHLDTMLELESSSPDR
jgi:thiol-disulfide isomerase/thioredoxin